MPAPLARNAPHFARKAPLWLLLGLLLAAFLFLPAAPFDYWDFRNNLWGPARLLLGGHSPYEIKRLFPDTNAVWFPQAIGFFFPLGALSFGQAAQVWLLLNLAALGGLIFHFSRPSGLRPLALAAVVAASLLFPGTVEHIRLGQISLLVALALTFSAHLQARWGASGLLAALALGKPQLCLLVLPGILLQRTRQERLVGSARWLGGLVLAWLALLVPLFVAAPNWLPAFAAALHENNAWAQPSLLSMLRSAFGPANGFWLWLLLLGLAQIGNAHLWRRLPTRQATAWSLALTCLVSPYLWSWDFVLLLPCAYVTFVDAKNWQARAWLAAGFMGITLAAWLQRWNASVSDEVYAWVPAALIALYASCAVISFNQKLRLKRYR